MKKTPTNSQTKILILLTLIFTFSKQNCAPACKTCTDYSTCTSCNSGYYLDKLYNYCYTCSSCYSSSYCQESGCSKCFSSSYTRYYDSSSQAYKCRYDSSSVGMAIGAVILLFVILPIICIICCVIICIKCAHPKQAIVIAGGEPLNVAPVGARVIVNNPVVVNDGGYQAQGYNGNNGNFGYNNAGYGQQVQGNTQFGGYQGYGQGQSENYAKGNGEENATTQF